MASTVVDDKSAALADESDAAVAATVTTASCLNDPNYAIICVFLEKFGAHLKIQHPDFLKLQKMIENTDEVHEDLKQFMIRLLRKTRKSVQPDKLDSALAKFCYTYSSQDAWEVERFGYKKSSLAVKLRILKEILESQFDKNPAFRTVISAQSATDLRSQPLGKDKLGNAYWSTLDEQCNLRIYQEHLDEEIWKVVATNRDEMAKLISCLKGNELVLPSLVGIVDEDSSSNSMPPKVDALQNGAAAAAAAANQNETPAKCENVPSLKIKLNAGNSNESTVEQIKTDGTSVHASKADAGDDGDDDDDESNVSEIDESSQAASESSATTIGTKSNETQSSKRYSLLASKPPSNKSKHRIPASDSKARINAKIKTQSWSTGGNKRNLDDDGDNANVVKSKRPSMMSGSKRSVASNKYNDLDDGESSEEEGSEEMDDELEEEEEEELSEISDGDVGDEIEEPTMYVRGEGSGKANKSIVPFDELLQIDHADDNAVGEAIIDDVIYVFGEGSGRDCDVGNNDIKATTDASSSDIAATTKPLGQPPVKPMFFFGQAGCLKLSPMKTAVATPPSVPPPQSSLTTETNAMNDASTQEISNNKQANSTPATESTSHENNSPESVNTGEIGNDVPSNEKPEEKPKDLQNDAEAVETTLVVESSVESASKGNEIDGKVRMSVDETDRIPVEEEPCVAKFAYVTTDEDGMEKETQLVVEPPKEQPIVENASEDEAIAPETPQEEPIAAETLNEEPIADDKPGSVADADVSAVPAVNEPLNEICEETEQNEISPIVNDIQDSEVIADKSIDDSNKQSDVNKPPTEEIVDNVISEPNPTLNNEEIESKNITETTAVETGAAVVAETTIDDERHSPNTSEVETVPSLPLQVEAAASEIQEGVSASEAASESVVLESVQDNELVEAKAVDQTERVENIEIDASATIEPTAVQSASEFKDQNLADENVTSKTIESQEEIEPVERAVECEQQAVGVASMKISDEVVESNEVVETAETAVTASSSNLTETKYGDDRKDTVEVEDAKENPVQEVEPHVEQEASNIAVDASREKAIAQSNQCEEPAIEEELHVEKKSEEDSSQQEELPTTEEAIPELSQQVESSESMITPEATVQQDELSITEAAVESIQEKPPTVDTAATSDSSPTVPHVEESQQISGIVVNEPNESPSVAENATEIPVVTTVVVNESTEIPHPPIDRYKHDKSSSIGESEPVFTSISEKRKGDKLSPTDGNECKKICEEGKIVDECCSSAESKVPLSMEPQEIIRPSIDSNEPAAVANILIETPKVSAIDEKLKTNSFDDSTLTIVSREELTNKNVDLTPIENDESGNNTTADANSSDLLPKASTLEIPIEPEQSVVVANAPAIEVQPVVDEVETKLPSPKTEQIPIESKISPAKAAQSRTRKRRLSGEKIRLTSESENDGFDAAAVEALPPAPDASSDDEVGGKRIKMRTKVSLRNVRKCAEEKRRNQKESECSSDDNERLIAKASTSESRPKLRSRKVETKPAEEKLVKLETVEQMAEEKPSVETKPEIKAEEVKQEADAVETENAVAEDEPEVPAPPPRRAGRPPRKAAAKKSVAAKPKATPKAPVPPKEEKIVEAECVDETAAEPVVVKDEVKTESSDTAKPQPRKKKRSLLGLDVSDVAIIPATTDGETPVRQSRRIAQIKIKEEAERRKAEEIALKKMKEASEKKKKGSPKSSSAAAEAPSDGKSESEEENSESEQKLEKKKKRKKGNKERPWQTDSSDSSERDEEDVEEHEEVERLPPLRSDHEFSPESDIEDVIVPTKRARTARKDVTEKGAAAESSEDEDIHACQKCSKNDHPEWILLCDKCDKGYHCSCLIPVLFVIPEGSWFCPPCQQEKLIEELESKLVAYDAVVKQKEIEEANRQRILFTSINEANVLKEANARKGKPRRERSQRTKDDGSSDDYSSSSSSSESEEEKIEKRPRRPPRPIKHDDDDDSNSDGTSAKRNDDSSAATDSEDEPIYKLRKRRQTNISYRFNEYDELINRAIKSEMDEVAGAGNLGRGKDISTIIEADKEEKRQKKEDEENEAKSRRGSESDHAENAKPAPVSRGKHMGDTDEDSDDSEPIKPKVVKRSGGKNTNKKKKKLNSLDVDSDEDDLDSDDDFKTSSYSDDEEEEDATSADSESSLEFLAKRGKKGRIASQRPVRERKKRYDADFIDDNSDDDDDIPLSKKKKKVESDFSDFNDSSDDEIEEDVDSEDLCDDSSEGSDRAWQKSRKSAKSKSKSANTSRPAVPKAAPKKKPKDEGERAFKASTKKKAVIASDDDDEDEVLPKSRRTRGKRLPYLLEDEFDSSDDGIKPGVKRPDTPPEERAAFIQKQEEIKRMLAEKNPDGPKPSVSAEKSKKNAPKDSLSTIPLQIIQTAKALDVDLKKTAAVSKTAAATSDNDSNGFDDDLPEDFDPEDMDEDEIAKMMEEEEFAQQQLKLAGEAIRNKRLKDTNDESPKKDVSPMKIETTSPSVIMPHLAALVSPTNFTGSLTIPDIPPSMYTVAATATTSNTKITTTPKKRGRKFKDDNPLLSPTDMIPKAVKSLDSSKEPMIPVSAIQHTASLANQKPPSMQMHLGPSTMHSPPIQQHTPSVISHSSSVIQHQRSLPPTTSSLLGIARNQEPIIPSTVLEVQNTRLLDPSELGRPPQLPPSSSAMHNPVASLLDSPVKKRGRRKKITPMRDQLTNPTATGIDLRHPNMPPSQTPLSSPPNLPAPTMPDTPKTSILSERLAGNPVDIKRGLPIGAQPPPPHLYAPSSGSQTSVIRLNRPPHNAPPFSSGNAPQQQRYYPPNHALPPSHTLPSHVRSPYHAPNSVVTTSGHRPPPLVNAPPSSSHLSHPMYMRRGQPTMYGTGYPGMPPPQMHRALQAMEAASGSAQEYPGSRPYQNLPFGNYYPPPGPTSAHLTSSSSSSAAPASERRPSAVAISTFDRYAQHHPNISISTISAPDDERPARGGDANAPVNTAASAGGGSEFSGLVSYFSSQQDDLDT